MDVPHPGGVDASEGIHHVAISGELSARLIGVAALTSFIPGF